MKHFKFFYRNGCHLCEDMLLLIHPYESSHNINIEMFNIDQDDDLQNKFGLLIPVLTDQNNNEICHYFFDKASFEQAIAAKNKES